MRVLKQIHMLLLVTLFAAGVAGSQNKSMPASGGFPFQNPSLTIDERVGDLVSRMTLDEKVKQMLFGAPAIPRLGVPEYNWWGEALHGVARAGKATVFPQAIGLAAAWDTDLMLRVATVISDEARAKHHDALRKGRRGIYEGLTFWSPNINIFRDPRWGRGMETYGEDPYLTGRLGVQFVKGLQGDDPKYFKTISTPKHFAVHSGPEPDRHVFDAVVNERDLRETYLPAFRATVIEANAQSVMCAYNRFRGEPCCGSSELLQKILRDEWGFSGYVVSDCWAIMDFYTTHKVDQTAPQAAARALVAGTDLNCGVTYDSLGVAVRQGLVSEQLVDVAVKRLFRARFGLGMFDPPRFVPYANIPISNNDSRQHQRLAVESARKSIVLLKNDGNLLPLRKGIKTIAVIGPNADDVDLLLGNYNGLPSDPVTPLAGIRRGAPRGTKILYARGCPVAESIPSFEIVPPGMLFTEQNGSRKAGLTGEYFNNDRFDGRPFVTRVDPSINFNWWEDPPMPGLRADSFSIRWKGVLVPPMDGRYVLGVRAFGGARLWIADSLLFDASNEHGVITQSSTTTLKAGVAYAMRIEYWDLRADASMQLVWSPPAPKLRDEALAAAKSADIVLLMMGLSPRLEGEEMPVEVPGFKGGDRVDLGLPRVQEELIQAVAAIGKPVVLVLLSGSAVAVNWEAEHIPAIVEAWYPGQAAGTALADVLFGNYNPAGRLPVTFYKSANQIPPFSNYTMEGKTYRYFKGEPLFPFGHGLSYTTFMYSNLKLPSTVPVGKNASVSVDVKNSGNRSGEEVVQLYVSALEASAPVPIRALQGFRRVQLKAGETKTVSFTLTPRQLSFIDASMKRVVEPGTVEVSLGGKQPGLKGMADAPTSGVVVGQFTMTGSRIQIGEKPN
ncbi:MAG: glycoside hydrolase family 3 C-terminal domain-containing protein [Ignavibacteriales bacterium]|nr:glycoside hydrolase family 3 C-terminal domain-containing protein [Ignavibacteriales bacterium]